jgi:hypothetical protein
MSSMSSPGHQCPHSGLTALWRVLKPAWHVTHMTQFNELNYLANVYLLLKEKIGGRTLQTKSYYSFVAY